ncbi:MAG: hypothetical protein M3444_09725 [Acidobacteriota bacterium]|nr:hypothetical protein [Acidobacteriota bacterium]MDQ5835681.1 hypothetical protein [Acidobacteriota bacterium]
MSVPRDNARFGQSGDDVFAAGAHACPACGARARRAGARYCSTCGQSLGDEYFPTDSLRASYRFERVPPQARASGAARMRSSALRVRSSAARRGGAMRPGAGGRLMQTRSMGGITATARAFATYALVPYLGILFCPGALLLGFAGLLRARRTPHASGARRSSALVFALGLLILCVQLLLWWILYKVPEWSRQMGNF